MIAALRVAWDETFDRLPRRNFWEVVPQRVDLYQLKSKIDALEDRVRVQAQVRHAEAHNLFDILDSIRESLELSPSLRPRTSIDR
jgi:hypothetical protein